VKRVAAPLLQLPRYSPLPPPPCCSQPFPVSDPLFSRLGRCAAGGGGAPKKERVYIGKGRYVEDDPRKYPGREDNNAAGGWAGGEKGLWQFREAQGAVASPKAVPVKKKGPTSLPPSLDVRLTKDFGNMAGGFPGGEVGVKAFTETGRIATRDSPPSVGLSAYVAVTLAGAYAACVYATGDVDPRDWEFVTATRGGAAPVEQVAADGKKIVRLPSVALPPVDPGVAKAVAPPAAVVGGVVAAGLAVQALIRKLAASVSRGLVTALFLAAVLAAALRILNLL
jgi:hypothetical protein